MEPANLDDSHSDEGDNSGRCLFCLQEPKDMKDPKLLPCGDVVCLACIQRKPKSMKFKCPACKKMNPITDLETLPDFRVPKSPATCLPVAKKSSPSKSHCAVCLKYTEVVGYCVQCDKIMCGTDLKTHDAFFKVNKHQVIDYQLYKVKPDYYTKPVCEEHDNTPISAVCEKCYDLKCSQCFPTICENGGHHSFMAWVDMRNKIQTRLEHSLSRCKVKVTELCALEKKTWQTADSLAERCADMVTQIEETAEQQICDIRQRAEKLKQEVISYQANTIDKIEVYLQGVIDKRENLQEFEHTSGTLLMQHNIKDLFDFQSKKEEEINGFNIEPVPEPEFYEVEMALHPKELMREKEPELVPKTPSKINLIKAGEITVSYDHSRCRSVEFLDSSHVLVATGKHMGLYEVPSMKFLNGVNIDSDIQSISYDQKSQSIIFITLSTAYKASRDLLEHSALFPFCYDYEFRPRVAANEHFIVIANAYLYPNKYHVHLYNRKNETMDSHDLQYGNPGIASLRFNPNGNLMVLNDRYNVVLEYRINNDSNPELIHTIHLPHDAHPHAICTDLSALVYVVSGGRMIYLIFNGEIMKSVTSPALPQLSYNRAAAEYHDLSVYRDQMIVTEDESNKFRLLAMT